MPTEPGIVIVAVPVPTSHVAKLRARPGARWLGASCSCVGALLVLGAMTAPDVGAGGAAVLIASATVFCYIGYLLVLGYVTQRGEVLIVKEGFRTRRFEVSLIQGLEICDAQTFIRGQRTVGLRVGDGVVPLNLLAAYPTRHGLLRLERQRVDLSRMLHQ